MYLTEILKRKKFKTLSSNGKKKLTNLCSVNFLKLNYQEKYRDIQRNNAKIPPEKGLNRKPKQEVIKDKVCSEILDKYRHTHIKPSENLH